MDVRTRPRLINSETGETSDDAKVVLPRSPLEQPFIFFVGTKDMQQVQIVLRVLTRPGLIPIVHQCRPIFFSLSEHPLKING